MDSGQGHMLLGMQGTSTIDSQGLCNLQAVECRRAWHPQQNLDHATSAEAAD